MEGATSASSSFDRGGVQRIQGGCQQREEDGSAHLHRPYLATKRSVPVMISSALRRPESSSTRMGQRSI